MKKLLSFVIVAMMIVSCIVPAFALTTAPTAEAGVENTLSIWVEDAEYDETAQTLTVYLNVANNEDGFEYLKVYVFYPECLTLSSTKGAGFAPTKEITAGIENSGWTKNLKDALDTMGTPVPAGADYQDYYPGLKYTSPCIDRVGETDEGEDDDCFDNGRWCALTFTYDESKNTIGAELPITLVNSPDDQMHVYREGYEWSDEMIDVVVYGGIATVPAGEQPPVCEHANTHDEITTPATCTEAGLKNVVCDDCGAIVEENVEIPATGHTYEETARVPSTCTQAGSVTYTCACGDSYSEDLPLAEHVKGIRASITKAPTTAEAGTLSYKCAVCDQLQAGTWDEELPAIAPAFAVSVANASAEPGVAATAEIAITNTNYGVDMLRFLVYWDKNVTVTAAASDEVYSGEDDSFSFKSQTAQQVKSLLNQAEITFATAGKNFAILVCDIPDDESDTRKASGAIATLTLTAAAEGEYAFGIVNIDNPNASYFTTGVNADEEEETWGAGFIDYDMPETIDATFTVAEAPAEHVHDYVLDEEASTPATCTEPGENVYVCQGAGECDEPSYSVVVPAAGHDLVNHEGQPATCTEVGWEAYQTCTKCDYTTYEEIPTIDHDYVPVVTEPSCTEGGYTTYTCSMCGDDYIADETEALGHNYVLDEEQSTPATCSAAGTNVYVCSRCGDSYDESMGTTAHTPGEWVTITEPTPEADGVAYLYCSECGEKMDEKPLYYKTLDAVLRPGAPIASGEIDNVARTITLVTKKDQPRASYDLVLPKGAVINMSENAFAAGNKMKIKNVLYEAATNAPGIRYMVSYAANGYNQSYTLEIVYAGITYEYTVNVTFDHTAACGGVEPGYTADAALTGFDAEDDHLINVVSKPGETSVAFRFTDLAKGATISAADPAAKPHFIQTADAGETYEEVDGINENAYVYLKTLASDAAQEYDIVITFANGDSETYHVVVTFTPIS